MTHTNDATYVAPIMVRGKGIGFFRRPDAPEDEQDWLIVRDNLERALNGDMVEVRQLPAPKPGERQEAAVVRVVESARTEFIGIVKPAKDGRPTRYLQPDDLRLHIRPSLPDATAADEGMKVVVSITEWKQPLLEPTGEVIEVLGRAGDHETEMQAIIRGGGFSENFPPPIAEAATQLYERREEIFRDAVAETTGDNAKRRDFRDRLTMTIDPKDAKDFDDALSFRELGNGMVEIGIHIADVSHYVREGEPIDDEAQSRGTSIYLVDRVIPMLPEVLSNDLCSLRPNEDRLAFSAIFELNAEAEIVNEWYGQTIIRSDKRFSYEDAQSVLDAGAGEHHDTLATMMSLGRLLRKQRHKAGAIAFEQPEVRFELDETGKPIRVYTKTRTETMLMIEDFMLLANQKVTEYIYTLTKSRSRDAAFIYRVHDSPNPDKIEELSLFIHALGYEFETHQGVVTAKNINKLLKEVEGKPEENLVKTATIRSMAKAIYSTKNIGHFGLAFKYYTHFTSPIRRYPDLMAHRLLRKHLDGAMITGKDIARYEQLAVRSSERELYAVRAERDSIKFKQVEYMLDKIGQTFDGVITGVADWGVYVQEKNSQAEGLVRLASMRGDYYNHEPQQYRVKGERTGSSFSLGDEVKIKLTRASLEERQLDFEFVK